MAKIGRIVLRVSKRRVVAGKWIAIVCVGVPWSLGVVSDAWAEEKLNRVADWIVKGVKDSVRIDWSDAT